MTSHLRVTIDDIDLVLTEDTSLSVEMKNPYLNDGIDTYTYSFDVPLDGNRELLGDLDNPDSDRRLTSIEGHPMAIYIDGVLFAHGKVATIEEQTIVDKVSISMTSNKKQLKDMIGDLQLRDLTFPLSDKKDLQIGEKIGNIRATSSSMSSYSTVAHLRGYGQGMYLIKLITVANNISSSANGYVQPQALGFSAPKEYGIVGGEAVVNKDFINVSEPYKYTTTQPDGTLRRWLYHNARICYLHHAIDGEGKTLDTVQIDKDKYGPYYLLEADRPQSGICFYVMYIIDVLFKQLEMMYDDSPIYAIEDMRRLSFFTTLCKYDIDTISDAVRHFSASSDFSEANKWLEDRNIKGKLSQGYERNKKSEDEADTFKFVFYKDIYLNYKPDDSDKWIVIGNFGASGGQGHHSGAIYADSTKGQEQVITEDESYHINVHIDRNTVMDTTFWCYKMDVESEKDDYEYEADVVRMYANADNLPDMSVQTFLDSLWASFGLRFHYDSESNVVTPYFIRDVLRNNTVHSIFGSDISVHKIAEKITGVRMKYSAESDRKEQLAFIRKGVSDYDTRYDYLVDKTPVDDIITSKRYTDVSHGTMSVNDMNLYIDTVTGNAYRIKINKDELDAGNIGALQPSLFQVAQFKGILEMDEDHRNMADSELMDPDVAEYIQEISSDFEPLVQNDLYSRRAKETQVLAPFTDEDMWNESSTMDTIRNPVDSNAAYVHYVDLDISEEERYDIGTDDRNSPLQHIDWGSTICIMRGGGSDADINHYDRGYDFFGNEKWRMISGLYCMDYDTLSNYAEEYDYNGTTPGIGAGTNGYYSGTYSKKEAEQLIREIFSYSNVDVLSMWRVVPGTKMQAAGYTDFSADDYATYYDGVKGLSEYDGHIHHFVFVRITDYGEVYTETQIMAYLKKLEEIALRTGRPIMEIDQAKSQDDIIALGGGGQRMLVAYYDNEHEADYYSQLLHQLGAIYYGDDATGVVSLDEKNLDFWIEHNAKYDETGRFSLAIRAYHRHPLTGRMLCSPKFSRRGLADTFFSEYIYFLLHRKKLAIKTLCEIEHIIDMQWKDRYCIAGHTGWIDQLSVKVSVQNGIEKVEFTMFEL